MVMAVGQLDWPSEPYKGLAYYGSNDALLFVGRDDDIDACVQFLTEPRTRMLLLHGRTGCGKSSFLRAGLVPALEARGFGYQFLRRAPNEDPVFIRCGADPISRIAEELFRYVSTLPSVPTAKGMLQLDLSSARLGHERLETFVEACRTPGVLISAFVELSKRLLHTLVIILDQAEEIITLTEHLDDSRQRFFHFLQDFNATNLDARLILALRKEHFGEFFGLIQLDASIKTDIKQFLLLDLDYEEVLAAIELPTMKSPRHGNRAPYQQYRFEFAPGVAKRIANDLFAAVPSGGVLPVMQIVCRDLYNEVRSQSEPWIIDDALYEAGERVTGRVGRHISRSLQSSFQRTVSLYQDSIEEERRWREVLLKLVRRDADGTVKTGLVSAEQLQQFITEAGVTSDQKQVLGQLTKTDILILRSFSIYSIDNSKEETFYSLGHDAIGLALYEWKLREDEAKRRWEAERKAVKLARWSMAAGALAIGIFLGAWIWITHQDREAKRTEIGVLQAAVDRLSRKNVKLAITTAIEAVLAGESLGTWWSPADPEPVRNLQKILTSLPKKLVTPTFNDGDNRVASQPPSSDRTFLLPKLGAFLFWDGRAQISTMNGADARSFDVTQILSPGGLTIEGAARFQLLDVAELEAGTIVLLFGSTVSDARDNRVVIVKEGQVVISYDLNHFLNQSEIVRAQIERSRGPSESKDRFEAQPNLRLTGSTICLYTRAGGFLSLEAFAIDPTAKRDELIARAGSFQDRRSQGGQSSSEPPAVHEYSLMGGVLIIRELSRLDAGSDQRGNRSRFISASFVDLRKQNAKPQSVASQALTECKQRRDRQSNCTVNNITRNTDSHLDVMHVSYSDTRESDKLVVIDLATAKTKDIELRSLDKLRFKTVERERSLDDRSGADSGGGQLNAIAAGNLESLVLGLFEGETIDVFRIDDGTPYLLGTLYSARDINRVQLTQDTKMLLGASGLVGLVWDIPEVFRETSKKDSATASELIRTACSNDWVAPVRSRTEWFDITGLTNGPPPKRCEALAATSKSQ